MKRLALLLCLAAPCAACGNEDPQPHGLKLDNVKSEPVGEPVQIAYALEDGEKWAAEIFLEAKQTKPTEASSRSTIKLDQTFFSEPEPHSLSRMRYVRVESSQGDVEPPVGVTEGHFLHVKSERGSKPRPKTRKLSGKNIELADTLYGSMMMSGLAGSPMWIPDRPIRQGEAWPAEAVLTPRMVALLLQQERKSGAAIPKPVFRGTVRVDRIDRDGQGGGTVVLTIRALIEVKGPMVQGRERGSIDMGYRVEGTATVDIRSGLPTTIDATAIQRMDFRSRAQSGEQRLAITLRAQARRVSK